MFFLFFCQEDHHDPLDRLHRQTNCTENTFYLVYLSHMSETVGCLQQELFIHVKAKYSAVYQQLNSICIVQVRLDGRHRFGWTWTASFSFFNSTKHD